MANTFGRGSMDCSSKFGLHQRDYQRDLLTERGRKKPLKFSNNFRHPFSQNVMVSETNSSHFKAGCIGQKQRYNVGFDSACAVDVFSESKCSDSFYPQQSYAPFNYSFFSENSSYSTFSPQLKNDFSESNVLSYESSSKYDDAENDKTANILTALVNKILEDTDCDNPYLDSASQFSEQMWKPENESIGELAIKLGDLNLQNELQPEPAKTVKWQPSSFDSGEKCYAKPVNQPFCKETIKIAKNDSSTPHCAFFSQKNEKPGKRKSDFTIRDMKKKKFIPSSWYNTQNPRKCTTLDGYGMRPVHRNIQPSQAPGQKIKNPSVRYSGSPFWAHYLNNDSKSDGSSSSNSSVYKDFRTSADSLNCKGVFNSNDTGRGPFNSKQPRRNRKTYSTASSSSGGKNSSECVFCKTNGETSAIYRGHVLKDDQGRTACRVLQQYVCPLCGATGYNAHTIKYCPKNENPPAIATMTTLKSMRSSTGRKRHGPCSGQIRPIPFGFNHGLLPA